MKTVSQIKPELRQKRRRQKNISLINELRLNMNLTIREVSTNTGIPIATLHRIEKKPSSCKVNHAIIIAEFYEKSIKELFV